MRLFDEYKGKKSKQLDRCSGHLGLPAPGDECFDVISGLSFAASRGLLPFLARLF
jgi:hypothetical protein